MARVKRTDRDRHRQRGTEHHYPHSTQHNGTTLGGVTHGVHHGVTHGDHYVSAKKNKDHVHQNGKLSSHRVKPNVHAGGAHGWIYTTKKGDTLQSLQDRSWPGSVRSQSPVLHKTSSTDIQSYANNDALLRSQGYKKQKMFVNNPSRSSNKPTGYSYAYNSSYALRPGTRIIL